MQQKTALGWPIRFGTFEVDPRAGELRKQGIKIKLQEQPLQVLAMLLEHPGEVVTREELQKRIWPADTFVDFENGLNKAINKLREALGDSAESPRFVETLPRHGYRFIAPVNAVAGEATARLLVEQPASAPAGPVGMPVPHARWRWRAPALALAVLLAGLVALNVAGLRDRLLGRTASPHLESLAVLPLENLSHDPQQEYFAEGMTEELITDLGKISTLRVISRTSAMHYKDTRKTLPEIARELDVDAVVEGAVLRSGDRVRITVQLIQAATDRHLWAETYERDLRDVFAVQKEIAGSIANALRLKLGAGPRRYTENPEAYQLYLRGRYTMERFPGGPRNALQYFEQAIAKDANYALAYAGAADAFVAMGGNLLLPHDEAYAQAKAAAEKALELDPMLSEAHTALARIRTREYAWQEAERSFRRAIELNPNNALARLELGLSVLVTMGRFDEALGEIRRSLALDPLSGWTSAQLAYALLVAGRYKEAMDQAREAIVLDPNRGDAYLYLGRALSWQGKHVEARAALLEADRRGPGGGVSQWLACADVRAGRRDEALRSLQKNLQGAFPRPVPARRLVIIYACLGDKDHAFEYLGKVYAERETGLPISLQYPELAWMRSDPRFAALRQKVGLAP